MSEIKEIQKYRANLEDELNSVALYQTLATKEKNSRLAEVYRRLAATEQGHAEIWAEKLKAIQKGALQALSRDELGIDPEELGGSAWEAAITSFLLFALGAVIPVIPYTFLYGWNAVIVSAILSAAGLFLVGAAITLFTGRPVVSSGLRQMVFGLVAALVTYLIGSLIGVSVAG